MWACYYMTPYMRKLPHWYTCIYIMWDYNDQKECFCFRQDEVSYIEESSSEEEEEEEEEQHDTLSFRHHRQDEDEEDAPEVTMGGGKGGRMNE